MNDNIVFFYSNSMASKLSEYTSWALNGTFKVVPAPFYQLYTLVFIRENHIFPWIFKLLKNKQNIMYVNIFNSIKRLKASLNLQIIETDFMNAAICAVNELFQRARVSSCQFRLEQALCVKYKKVN